MDTADSLKQQIAKLEAAISDHKSKQVRDNQTTRNVSKNATIHHKLQSKYKFRLENNNSHPCSADIPENVDKTQMQSVNTVTCKSLFTGYANKSKPVKKSSKIDLNAAYLKNSVHFKWKNKNLTRNSSSKLRKPVLKRNVIVRSQTSGRRTSRNESITCIRKPYSLKSKFF